MTGLVVTGGHTRRQEVVGLTRAMGLPELQEQYVELMCVVQSNQVYAYLKEVEGYHLEQTLEVCVN